MSARHVFGRIKKSNTRPRHARGLFEKVSTIIILADETDGGDTHL